MTLTIVRDPFSVGAIQRASDAMASMWPSIRSVSCAACSRSHPAATTLGGDTGTRIPGGGFSGDGSGQNSFSGGSSSNACMAGDTCQTQLTFSDRHQELGTPYYKPLIQFGQSFSAQNLLEPASFLQHPYATIRFTQNNVAKLAANHFQPFGTKSFFNSTFANPQGAISLILYAITNAVSRNGPVLDALYFTTSYGSAVGFDRNTGFGSTSIYTVQVFNTNTLGTDGKPVYNFVNMFPGNP